MRTSIQALIVVLMAASPVAAALGTIHNVPAATLLYPYFEVDLSSSQGQTTLIAIQNASASAVLTKVILWTDASVPVLDFHVYLTGFDVQTMNVRDLLDGILPSTNAGIASCSGFTPPPSMTSGEIADLKAALTGAMTSSGSCAGFAHGDGVARGYITVDSVVTCSSFTPHDPEYFADDSTRIASDSNDLIGDYFFIDPANNFAQGERAVHIEASSSNLPAGEHSFYGRYVGFDGTDRREPLPVQWATPYTANHTQLIAWRDSHVVQNPFNCNTGPSWYPLVEQQVVVFDSEENPDPVPESPVFPLEAGRAEVGPGRQLPTTAKMGWAFFDLTHAGVTGTSQGWILKVDVPEDIGVFTTSVPATFYPRP